MVFTEEMAYSDVKRRTVKIVLPPGGFYQLSDFEGWAESHGLEAEDIVAAGPMRSSNVWQFTFRDTECVEKVLQDIEVCVAGKTGRISHVGEKFVEIRVNWLPFYIEDGAVIAVMEQYGTVLSFKYSKPVGAQESGIFKEATGLTRLILLRTDVPQEQLPYTIRLRDGEEEVVGLVVVRGRKPKCFKCGVVGHERRECTTIFCTTCKDYHEPLGPSEICKGPTYAAMMRRTRDGESEREQRERERDGETETSGREETGSDQQQEEMERAEAERAERERAEAERVEREKVETERAEREKAEAETRKRKDRDEDGEREQRESEERENERETRDSDNIGDTEMQGQDEIQGAVGGGERRELPLGSSMPCHNPENMDLLSDQESGAATSLMDLVKDQQYLPEFDPALNTSMDSISSTSSLNEPPPRKVHKNR